MDQSKSNSGSSSANAGSNSGSASSPSGGTSQTAVLPIPKRSFSLEFFVGLFTFGGLCCAGYLAVGLGGLELVPSNRYEIIAEFDNVSGLKYGASVEIAGVPVGEVANIALEESVALVTLRLERSIQIRDDDIASIRTKGIIGDRYVKLSKGASDEIIPAGGIMRETESVVDLEDVIGKLIHNFTGEKEPVEGKKDAGAKVPVDNSKPDGQPKTEDKPQQEQK